MATGVTQTLDFSNSYGFTVRLKLQEEYDAAGNLSDVSVTAASLRSTNYVGPWFPGGNIYIDGTSVVSMSYWNPATHRANVTQAGSTFYPIAVYSGGKALPWKKTGIAHNTDGSKSISIKVNLEFYRMSDGKTYTVSATKTLTLTHIPRASTIGSTDANIGATSMIAVTRKSTAYTHSIKYAFGNLSGYIAADGSVSDTEVKHDGTSVAFTVPTSFYAQIPKAKTGTCTLTCTTYSGDTQIGDAQTATFTVTAAQTACAPVVSGTVVDSNEITKALTGDAAQLVRFYSNALCTITATARNSATISTQKIGGAAVTGSTRTIEGIEASSVAFAAMDSRGYETTTSVAYDLVPYVKLTNNPEAKRTDPTSGNAILTISGNYYNGSFGAADNALEIQYGIAVSGGIVESYTSVPAEDITLDGNTYAAQIPLSGLDYEYSFDVEVIVADKLASIPKTTVINKGIPIANWGKNNFTFNVPLFFGEKGYGSTLPETGKKGQCFFLLNSDGTYSVYIHNGESWA